MFLSHTLPLGFSNTYKSIMVAGSIVHASTACPSNVHWGNDGLERDLYIQTTTVPVLAMDGRRRWLDVQKLVSFIGFPSMSFKKFKIVTT